LPVILPPAQTLTLSVSFGPTAAGTWAGNVAVASNSVGSPESIAVSGIGVVQPQPYVLLDWTASASPAATGYNVYRSSVSGSGYVRVNGSVAGDLTYTDTAVQSGQTYYYVSTAVDANGDESGHSNEIQISVP
jgi:fibronectin type 3 domain-containing protein